MQKTHAHRKLEDDVPPEVKKARFQVLYDLFREEADILNREFVGTEQVVLVEKVRVRSILTLRRWKVGERKESCSCWSF